MAFSFAFLKVYLKIRIMQALSERMLNSGWILHKNGDASWFFRSPLGFSGTWMPEPPRPAEPPPELLRELEAVELAIEQQRISRYLGVARRMQPPLPAEGAYTALRLAGDHVAKGHAVLRFRAMPDPAGDQALLDRGAWRVETLLPPWSVPDTFRTSGFKVFTCEHLLDTLPRLDRSHLFNTLLTLCRPPDGVVYFTVVQMSGLPRDWTQTPCEDGYQVRYGHNLCFIKPYNETMLRRELTTALQGSGARAWIHHHELAYTWRPHA